MKQKTENNRKINKTKSWFFENINKTDKTQTNLIRINRQMTNISGMREGRDIITTDPIHIKRRIMEYYDQVYANKFENQMKMHKFSERHKLPKFIQEERDNPMLKKLYVQL